MLLLLLVDEKKNNKGKENHMAESRISHQIAIPDLCCQANWIWSWKYSIQNDLQG